MAILRTDTMRNDPGYRQMELNPQVADGEMHSPENVRRQAEQARQQAEFYEAQRMQWEAQRRELEQSNEQKVHFNEGLNQLGMKLHNAVRRIDRELESLEKERRDLEEISNCFKRHLQILSSMQPQSWSTEGLKERLREAIVKLDRAENDYEEAYAMRSHFRHTDVLRHRPGENDDSSLSWKTLRDMFAKGLAFHLPLFVLLLITWLVLALCLP